MTGKQETRVQRSTFNAKGSLHSDRRILYHARFRPGRGQTTGENRGSMVEGRGYRLEGDKTKGCHKSLFITRIESGRWGGGVEL